MTKQQREREERDDYGRFYDAHLIRNFRDYELPLYKKAIEEYGDEDLYIDPEAYDNHGRRICDDLALKTKRHKCFDDFFELIH